MQWITSGIENPSKSEVIDRCGGNEKTEWTDNRTLNKNKKKMFKNQYDFMYM